MKAAANDTSADCISWKIRTGMLDIKDRNTAETKIHFERIDISRKQRKYFCIGTDIYKYNDYYMTP